MRSHSSAPASGGVEVVSDALPAKEESNPPGQCLYLQGGSQGSAPASGGVADRRTKYPRVDPPEVEDAPGQAVREDVPGYIAMAFPKLFPHGSGDFHDQRGGLGRLFKFEEWGRYIMTWHDGRFMRHTRFRYWLLDTSLRLMTPRMQRTSFGPGRQRQSTL